MDAGSNTKEAVIAIEEKCSAKQELVQEIKDKTSKEEAPVRNIFAPVTVITFLLSLPVLALVIWLLYMRDYDCEDILKLPRLRIGIGVSMIFVFLISNAVLFCKPKFYMLGLLVAMVPLILMLIVGLALLGAYNLESTTITGSPMWLKLKILNNNNWANIKSCIYDSNICNNLVSSMPALKSYDFSLVKQSSIESGCCKPPTSCGMEYVNATFWNEEENGGALDQSADNGDCESWNNDQNRLCYDCSSCREGFLTTLRNKWFKLGIFLAVMAILLITSHLSLFLATMWKQYIS